MDKNSLQKVLKNFSVESDSDFEKAYIIKPKKFLKEISLRNLLSIYTEYKIIPKNGPPPATTEEFMIVKVYWWGIRKPMVITNNCEGNGFYSVTIRKSFKQHLISILTLGIISPISIGWECAKDNQFP